MDPHWGSVGTGVTCHGATGLGLPLVPTVQAQVSYCGMAHLYRDGQLVDDNAACNCTKTASNSFNSC